MNMSNSTINALKNKFCDSRIYVALILPRKKGDEINRLIKEINKVLLSLCHKLNVTPMSTSNIHSHQLYDDKHLDVSGLYVLLANIRFALFGQMPSSPTEKGHAGKRPRRWAT